MFAKLGVGEIKDEDTEMEDAEFPRIRRTKVDKFMDEFDETDRELKILFIDYETTIAGLTINISKER